MSELVLYNEMCAAIAECARVDEVAAIKDKAAQLQAYAVVRDNVEAERQFAEIRLRACIRIGEISKELETAQGFAAIHANDRANTKTDTLQGAGIPIRTAQDYEQLSGGREEHAQKTAKAAAEAYLTLQAENKAVPTMAGLRAAVKGAITQTFGERTKSVPQKPREPDLLVHFLYSANYGAEKFDPVALASQVMDDFISDELADCKAYLPLL